jgi:hypothetical protein
VLKTKRGLDALFFYYNKFQKTASFFFQKTYLCIPTEQLGFSFYSIGILPASSQIDYYFRLF